MGRLNGKVAIITGSASGMGSAEALLFAKEGAKVVATDMNEKLLLETVEEINEEIGENVVVGVKHDVAHKEDWTLVVVETLKHFGKIDILVNNAGIGNELAVEVEDYPIEDWHKIINVNTTGSFLGVQAVVPAMKENGSGSIVNIASTVALVGGGGTPYSASKGAIRAMTRSLSVDLGKYDIRVNTVYPGFINTPLLSSKLTEEMYEQFNNMIPLGRMGEPNSVAYAVLFLASDEANFMTGADIVIDGGQTAG